MAVTYAFAVTDPPLTRPRVVETGSEVMTGALQTCTVAVEVSFAHELEAVRRAQYDVVLVTVVVSVDEVAPVTGDDVSPERPAYH